MDDDVAGTGASPVTEASGTSAIATDEVAAKAARSKPPLRRTRSIVACLLGFLCCVGVLASVVGVAARNVLFDTDHWVATVGPLASNEEILEPLGDYLTEQVMSVADLERRMRDRLPPSLEPIAIPLSASARTYVRGVVRDLLHTERFRTVWVETNRVAHSKVVLFLDGETKVAVANDGNVTVNLLPVINWVLQGISTQASSLFDKDVTFPEVTSGEVPSTVRERLSKILGREVPADFGEIPIYDSEKLGMVQRGVVLFRQAVTLLLVATVLLGAGAVLLARRTSRALVALGLGVVLAIAVGRAALGVAQRELLDLILKPDVRGALSAVLQAVFVGFTELTTWFIVAGLALLVLGFLLSEASAVRTLRSKASAGARPDNLLQTVGARRDAFALGGVVAALVAVVVIDGVTWSALIAIAVSLAIYEAAVAWAASNTSPIESVDDSASSPSLPAV